MSWFERHLNWTVVLSWIAAWMFSYIFGWTWGWGSAQISPVIRDGVLGEWTGLVGLAGASLIVLFATGWALRKKNRSLLHLLWYLLTWVGAIILLCLKNQSEVFESENDSLIPKPRTESE